MFDFSAKNTSILDNATKDNTATMFDFTVICEDSSLRDYSIMTDYSRMEGFAIAMGQSRLHDHCIIKDDSRVMDCAQIYGCARMTEFSCMGGRSVLLNDAVLSCSCYITGDTVISAGIWDTTPLQIQGSVDWISMITPNLLRISHIQLHTQEWINNYKDLLLRLNYNTAQISEYKQYIQMFYEKYKRS